MEGASLAQVAQDIRAMRIRGAAEIARQGAHALATHVAKASGAVAQRAAAEQGAQDLLASRPTAVSLRNGVERVLASIRAAKGDLAVAARTAANAFEADVLASRDAVALHGARLVADAGVVLTHCHSSSAVAVLVAAHRLNPALRVFATETRPFGQGLITSKALVDAGVNVTLVVDSAVEHVLATQGIRMVVFGADTVTQDGSLFNKIGTAGVAALAGLRKIPVVSAASFYKFTPHGPDDIAIEERNGTEIVPANLMVPGLKIHNPVFDCTPPVNIRYYLTETGPLTPAQAVAQALRRLKR